MYRIRKDKVSAVDVFAVIVVVLVIVVGIMGLLLYSHMTAPVHESPDALFVEEGDDVHFTYTGYLESSLVFETLDLDIAMDNDTHPKSLLFTWPEYGLFEPIEFRLGNGLPHVNFQGMEENGRVLEDAMVDLGINDTVTVIVLPEEGFGDHDASLIETLSLTETMDQIEVITRTEFGERFGVPATENVTLVDPVWGWDVRVMDVEQGPTDPKITIMNLPDEGELYSPYVGFKTEVVSVESGVNQGRGEIVMRHILVPNDAGKVMGISPHGDGKFIIVDVNLGAGTFRADFNSEKAGAVLRYDIKIVDIVKH